jgi:transcription initiation factor TFIIF subunit beta
MEGSDFIKQEFIKPEPSDAPAGIDEEDLYEDAGDLDFYDKNAPSNCFETLYLARVPKTMWEAWAKLTEKLGDDDEIQIGTLRTWNEPVPDASVEGGTRDETKLRMLLSANCPEHQGLPREYDLEVLDRNVNNHFIFSEEDLPGYKARNKARAEATKAGIPSSLLRAKQPEGEKRTYDRRSRYQPYYRKAIPSKQPDLSRVGRRS